MSDMRRASDTKVPVRERVIAWGVVLTLLLSGYSSIQSAVTANRLGDTQHQMQKDQKTLEQRRFKAERRACAISQNTVRNERRIIQRSLNALRTEGRLTRERLNFYQVTLKDLKVPSCSPSSLGFPNFEPDKLQEQALG